ncbi:MAG: hypothetical protein RL095_3082 [Verrucomicrobiota bacterium]|jgi:MoxR-like ATPase
MNPEQAIAHCAAIRRELAKSVIGQEEIVQQLLASLLARGHCLLVGVPGLAKTLLVRSLAQTLGVDFNRIQFTPDLMPADIIGSEVVREQAGRLEFEFRPGPVFTSLLLADEINRTPPKTQSSLLEAMQERRVTVAGKTRDLPSPFLVVATQNPIEQEGTYPLPEAQLDRFMFCLHLDYPTPAEEREVVRRTTSGVEQTPFRVIGAEEILALQALVHDMPVPDPVLDAAVKLAGATRPASPGAAACAKEFLQWGAGPRASQCLVLGAKANALLEGRVVPELRDVRAVAPAVLAHRVVLNYKATGQGITQAGLIKRLLEEVR